MLLCLFNCIFGYQEVPVYLALKQYNINILQEKLVNISSPESSNYGHWMEVDEINKIVSPPIEHQEKVLTWLFKYDVSKLQNHGDSIIFSSRSSVITNMFNTKRDSSDLLSYTIPRHLRNIIEFVEMYSKPLNRTIRQTQKCSDNVVDDRYFGREPLLKMYNVPEYTLDQDVSGGLIEYQSNNGFTNDDLNMQQTVNDQAINNLTNIIGENNGIDPESELDVQMMSQAADGIKLWFWDTPYWLYSLSVDFYNSENIPNIISMSWGWAEDSQCDIIDCSSITSKQYVERVNNEYLKISLRGTTILASSGDAGAPGRTNQGCDSSRPVNPIFPGSSPFVVSVGATYVPLDNTTRNFTSPLCLNNGCITSSNEKSISYDKVGWTAGGGFNLYNNETPFWQKREVINYLDSGVTLPTNFNINGRAYPDISAIGHSCPTFLNNNLAGIDGTSCSTPTVSGLLAFISKFIWSNYKLKVGFINPLLYYISRQCSDCFNDITEGYNWCTEGGCCENTTDYGFVAGGGYDPVSGLGTLNVGNIINFLANSNLFS